MSTDKHDRMMDQVVPMSIAELAALAHEAYELQAGTVAEADAHRYTRDSLQSSNDARAVLVDELRKTDDELRDERTAFGVMEQTALTLRAQLDVERAKHARATAHIAAMVRGDGWPEGRPNVWSLTIAQARHNVEAELSDLRAQVARLDAGLASAHAAQGIAPLEFAVGDYVRLIAARNDGVLDNVYLISEATPGSSLPYYLGDACQWVPASAVEAVEQPVETDEEPGNAAAEPRTHKVGERVARRTLRGVVTRDDGAHEDGGMPYWVTWDEGGIEPCDAAELTRIEWQPGERIEVGAEVEYVGGGTASTPVRVGKRGRVTSRYNELGASVEGVGLCFNNNLRRIS